MIYDAKYDNGERTVLTNFEEIVKFVRDTKVGASVVVWENGNAIMTFDVQV